MGWVLLIAGVLLWTGAHLWKRVAPASRERFGDAGKGIVTALLVMSIALMVFGYHNADGGPGWWGRSSALVGINNLLMLLAFYLFAASGAKTAITRRVKNPQLTAFKTFCVAHLLVNGDLAPFVLRGGVLAWAGIEVIVRMRAGVPWEPPHPVPMAKEITAGVIAVVAMVIVMLIHHWLGVTPWG